MQMLTTRGLFPRLPSEDLDAHFAKLRSVCKSGVGRPYSDINVIRLRLFSLSSTEDVAIWFTKYLKIPFFLGIT